MASPQSIAVRRGSTASARQGSQIAAQIGGRSPLFDALEAILERPSGR
jgi:hypothetical protein